MNKNLLVTFILILIGLAGGFYSFFAGVSKETTELWLSISTGLLTLMGFFFKENKNDVKTITSSTISIKDSKNNLAGTLVLKATYKTKRKPKAHALKANKKSAKILFTFDIDTHPNELGDGVTLQGDKDLNISIKRTNIGVQDTLGIWDRANSGATKLKKSDSVWEDLFRNKAEVTGKEKKNVEETYQTSLSFNDLEKINKAIGGNKSYTFIITTKSGKKLNLVANNTSEIKEIFDELK